jgi:hydroxysqualene dehydroxylase
LTEPGRSRPVRLVVCGGGLAGVAAAVEAAGRGAQVTLVERRPFLGGKAYSFTDPDTGREVDNGQHVFLGCCPAYIGLLRLLGTARHTSLQRRLDAPVRDRAGRTGALRAAPLPAPLHLGISFAAYPHLSAAEKAAALRALAALAAMPAGTRARLDGQSFAGWLAERGQSPGAVRRFWDVIVLPTCNDRSDRVSAALAAFVFQRGFLRTARGSAIGWSRVGLTRLVDPAARAFLRARGGRVIAGAAVAEAGPGGVTLADGAVLPADAVVLALPPQRVRAVAPAALRDDPGLGSSPIVNVHLWYDRPVMDERFVAVVDSPAQWLFNRTAMGGGGGSSHHIAVSISGARDEIDVPRAELAEAMRAELEHLLPRARRARVLASAVVKEPQATFAAAPGLAARRPGPATPLEHVALAGAWTATGWPATMEGAVRSGIAAARHVLAAWPVPSG